MKTLKSLYMIATVACILLTTFFLSRPIQTTETMLCAFMFLCCAIGFVILFGGECTKIENKNRNQKRNPNEHRTKKG